MSPILIIGGTSLDTIIHLDALPCPNRNRKRSGRTD